MLEITRQQTVTATQTVSLDEVGGVVVLSLSDGEGHAFRQMLNTHDVGKILALLFMRGYDDVSLCQGDLIAKFVAKVNAGGPNELHLTWHDENGGDGLVRFDLPGEMVLEEALKSYCRRLMRKKP